MIKKYQDNDIAIVCKVINEKQKERLKKMCPIYVHKEQKIKCKTIIINYDSSILDYVEDIDNVKVCETIHADYTDSHYKKYPVIDKRVGHWIGITEYICNTFSQKFGVETELCYNPLTVEKQDKPLIIVSATRLSEIKGKSRMEKLGQALDKAGISYIWLVFTTDTNAIKNPNIIFMKPTLDIRKYIALADYVVQLSDSEALSYTINEALSYNVPIIVTPLPYLCEVGYEDGKTGYTIEFDCSNINEVVKKMVNKSSFINSVPKDNYDKYIVKGKSKYKEERKMRFRVRATNKYETNNRWDAERTAANNGVKVFPKEGDTWEVDYDRKEILVNGGYVTVVEEIKEVEVAVKEPVVEKAVKTTRKRTKKAE